MKEFFKRSETKTYYVAMTEDNVYGLEDARPWAGDIHEISGRSDGSNKVSCTFFKTETAVEKAIAKKIKSEEELLEIYQRGKNLRLIERHKEQIDLAKKLVVKNL